MLYHHKLHKSPPVNRKNAFYRYQLYHQYSLSNTELKYEMPFFLLSYH